MNEVERDVAKSGAAPRVSDERIGARLRTLEVRLEELSQEHNSLAHLFAASERFARANTPDHALDIAEEVLHNLVGAHRYAIWLVVGDGGEQSARCVRALDSSDDGFDGATTRDVALRCIAAGQSLELDPSGVPMCAPLELSGEVVGALYIGSLVPHLQRIEQLQRDLIELVASTLADSIVAGSARQERSARARWDALTI